MQIDCSKQLLIVWGQKIGKYLPLKQKSGVIFAQCFFTILLDYNPFDKLVRINNSGK